MFLQLSFASNKIVSKQTKKAYRGNDNLSAHHQFSHPFLLTIQNYCLPLRMKSEITIHL